MSSATAAPYRTRSRTPDPDPCPLGEIPLPPYVTAEDTGFAIRAVVVHAPERRGGDDRCRNDHAPHPCRLHRWGRRVLTVRGLSPDEIDRLVEVGDPTASPPRPGAASSPHPTLARPGRNEPTSAHQAGTADR